MKKNLNEKIIMLQSSQTNVVKYSNDKDPLIFRNPERFRITVPKSKPNSYFSTEKIKIKNNS